MTIIKEFLSKLIEAGKREDGRTNEEHRKIEIIKNPLIYTAGSARVKLGKTDVIAGVMMDVGEPFDDTPDEGILMVNSELNPMAGEDYELGPPKEESIELARVIDRMIRESHVIDVEKLCIKSGEKVWTVFVDLYPINADGNLFDACALAAMVALTNGKMPKYNEKTEKVIYGEFTDKKIPVKTKPMLCTFGKVNNTFFIDPTNREEKIMDARLSIATTEDGNIHDMQKGGPGLFNKTEILKMVALATEKGKELRKHLK